MQIRPVPIKWADDVARIADAIGPEALARIRESLLKEDGRLATIQSSTTIPDKPWHSARTITVVFADRDTAIRHKASRVGSTIAETALEAFDLFASIADRTGFENHSHGYETVERERLRIARGLAVCAAEAARHDGVDIFNDTYHLSIPRLGGRAHLLAIEASKGLEAFDMLQAEDGEKTASLVPECLSLLRISNKTVDLVSPIAKVDPSGIGPIESAIAVRESVVPAERMATR